MTEDEGVMDGTTRETVTDGDCELRGVDIVDPITLREGDTDDVIEVATDEKIEKEGVGEIEAEAVCDGDVDIEVEGTEESKRDAEMDGVIEIDADGLAEAEMEIDVVREGLVVFDILAVGVAAIGVSQETCSVFMNVVASTEWLLATRIEFVTVTPFCTKEPLDIKVNCVSIASAVVVSVDGLQQIIVGSLAS